MSSRFATSRRYSSRVPPRSVGLLGLLILAACDSPLGPATRTPPVAAARRQLSAGPLPVPYIVTEDLNTGVRGVYPTLGATLGKWTSIGTFPTDLRNVGIGDLTNDGQTDLVFENTIDGSRWVLDMNGTVPGQWRYIITVPTEWHITGVDDISGDGKLDWLWEDTATGERGLYRDPMNGTTNLSWVRIAIVPTELRMVASGDFTGDGRSDIIFENRRDGGRWVLEMNGSTPVRWISIGTIPTDLKIVGSGDFNGDGKRDLLFENSYDGTRWVLRMSGSVALAWMSLGTLPVNRHFTGTGQFTIAPEAQPVCTEVYQLPPNETFPPRLADVWGSGPNDVWAVGTPGGFPFAATTADVVHWDGNTWTRMKVSPPPPVGGRNGFMSVTVGGTGPNDVWIGGSGSAAISGGTNDFAYRAHWNGSTWTTFNTAGTKSGPLWGVGQDMWAAGYNGTLMEHWSGSAWVPFPYPGTATPVGLSGTSAVDIWAVESSLVRHWDGVTWATYGSYGNMGSVAATAPNQAWVGGNLVELWSGSEKTVLAGGYHASNIAALGPNEVWFVDDFNRTQVYRWNGVTLSSIPRGTSSAISGVWVTGPRDAWLVTDAGSVVRCR